MNNCARKKLEIRYNGEYCHIDNLGFCIYCGDRATSQDHFTPLSFVAAVQSLGMSVSAKVKVLLPSCLECNHLAGAKIFNSIHAKRCYIQKQLRRRYRKILQMPEWEGQDLTRLGPFLSRFVRDEIKKRAWLEERLAWRNRDNPAFLSIRRVGNCNRGILRPISQGYL